MSGRRAKAIRKQFKDARGLSPAKTTYAADGWYESVWRKIKGAYRQSRTAQHVTPKRLDAMYQAWAKTESKRKSRKAA